MTTGEKIKQARTAAGLTQKDLAAKLEIVPNTISQYENGTRKPKIETLRRIANAIDFPLFELIGDDMKISREEYTRKIGEIFNFAMFGDDSEDAPERIREDERPLLRYYRELDGTRKDKVVGYAADQWNLQKMERTAPEDGPGHIQNS